MTAIMLMTFQNFQATVSWCHMLLIFPTRRPFEVQLLVLLRYSFGPFKVQILVLLRYNFWHFSGTTFGPFDEQFLGLVRYNFWYFCGTTFGPFDVKLLAADCPEHNVFCPCMFTVELKFWLYIISLDFLFRSNILRPSLICYTWLSFSIFHIFNLSILWLYDIQFSPQRGGDVSFARLYDLGRRRKRCRS